MRKILKYKRESLDRLAKEYREYLNNNPIKYDFMDEFEIIYKEEKIKEKTIPKIEPKIKPKIEKIKNTNKKPKEINKSMEIWNNTVCDNVLEGSLLEKEYLEIDGKIIQIIIDKDIKYFPITYLFEKIFKRNVTLKSIKKTVSEKEIKVFEIDFGENNIQKCNCISSFGISEYFNKHKIIKNIQMKNINFILDYIGADLIDIYINDNEYIDKLTEYEKLLFKEMPKNRMRAKWKKCGKCNNYYPAHGKFYFKNNKEFSKICKKCEAGKNTFEDLETEHSLLYNKQGIEIFDAYKDNDFIFIYESYINNNLEEFPKRLKNRKAIKVIVDYLFYKGKINSDNLNCKYLENTFKIENAFKHINTNKCHEEYFGLEECTNHLWKYKNYKILDKIVNYDLIKNNFNNYISENKIIIDDILKFNYMKILKEIRLLNHCKDPLAFIVEYNEFRYPAYKFKTKGVRYWKYKENVNREMKYLIEEDMKIPIDKIPLYLTKNNLHNKSATLYNLVSKKIHHNSIFEWINDIYPNKFIALDFEVYRTRNLFDSKEEELIYYILKEEFENVIYNKRNTENTVSFLGKVPDYLIITNKEMIIIEYFGMYCESNYNNKMIGSYIDKTNSKIDEYEKIGFKKVYLFPEDYKKGNKHIIEKIKEILR